VNRVHRRRLTPITALDAPVVFLCSDASRHVTGATLTIDDGQVL
jgi:NAD(P)-dependent dehydrogenase (short-subunit alcohol dehydrogenase family)